MPTISHSQVIFSDVITPRAPGSIAKIFCSNGFVLIGSNIAAVVERMAIMISGFSPRRRFVSVSYLWSLIFYDGNHTVLAIGYKSSNQVIGRTIATSNYTISQIQYIWYRKWTRQVKIIMHLAALHAFIVSI